MVDCIPGLVSIFSGSIDLCGLGLGLVPLAEDLKGANMLEGSCPFQSLHQAGDVLFKGPLERDMEPDAAEDPGDGRRSTGSVRQAEGEDARRVQVACDMFDELRRQIAEADERHVIAEMLVVL